MENLELYVYSYKRNIFYPYGGTLMLHEIEISDNIMYMFHVYMVCGNESKRI